jgi:two-component system, chemotaxis family, chemotaxis protein CheY
MLRLTWYILSSLAMSAHDPSRTVILLVEDEVTIRNLVRTMLTEQGYAVLDAADGVEALEVCQKFSDPIDLLITNVTMPRMDGLTLVKSLRGLSQYKAVPILILTTESSDSMKAEGKAAGATGWIVKPFDPKKLLEVVGKVLG